MPSSHSGTTGSSEPYFSPAPPPVLPAGLRSGRSSISRNSEASGRASSVGANMFDVGTVRMEAFIDHHAEQINRRGPPASSSSRGRHIRKTSSQFSHGRYEDALSVDGSELSFRSDPFRGF